MGMAKFISATAVVAVCVATHANAQPPALESAEGGNMVKHVMVRAGGPDGAMGNVAFTSSMEPQATVAEAPYSADVVTEVTQTLADGNRINRRTVSRVYRDSAGRVRREQAIFGVGPIGAADDDTRFIVIEDPVAKTAYALDSIRHEARKLPTDLRVNPEPGAGAARGTGTGDAPVVAMATTIDRRVIMTKDASGQVRVSESTGEGPMKHVDVMTAAMGPNGMSRDPGEPLGSRSIEGVNAEGTRWTRTIPAGAMGNERPIEIVTERWYSPELKTLILAKYSDPRIGETVYQLTNIVREEPPADLFVVPSDYKIVEGVGGAISTIFTPIGGTVVKPQ